MVLIMFGEDFGLSMEVSCRISAVITAVWWVVFSIPLIRNVKQTHFKPRVKGLIRSSFSDVWRALASFRSSKVALFFLIAFFCYIDGVHTIIKMATSIGADLGLDNNALLGALLVAQIVAFPSAIIYGKLADRFNARSMLMVGVAGYIGITVAATIIVQASLSEQALTVAFFALAVGIGLFQGGIQAISRAYFGKLIPKSKANEYYGFFEIFGKYAAILGTGMISLFTYLTGNVGWGVLSLVILFVLGLIFLAKIPKDGHEIETLK
jgi:UMF1 family MFS transporter